MAITGGKVICDLDKYAVYKNPTADTLVAIPLDENEKIFELHVNYDGMENVPAEITMDFFVLRYDHKERSHTFTETKRTFPINQLESIFISYN